MESRSGNIKDQFEQLTLQVFNKYLNLSPADIDWLKSGSYLSGGVPLSISTHIIDSGIKGCWGRGETQKEVYDWECSAHMHCLVLFSSPYRRGRVV